MDVALRVVTTIREGTNPIKLDVKSLKNWVAPQNRAATPSDLACMIILAELQRRKNCDGEKQTTN